MPRIATVRYRAFLSYCHRDEAFGRWLHAAIERYRVDRDLVGRPTDFGPVPPSLRPIFRDREDFSAGHSLTAQTLGALDASEALILLCSPAAAASKYVNEEVRRFKAMGRGDRIIPVIVDGEPGDPERECFPPALRFKVGQDGRLTGETEEPIAADARPQGDGRELTLKKVVAGLLGLRLDEVLHRAERARQRHNRVLMALVGLFVVLTATASGTTVLYVKKYFQDEARLDQLIEFASANVTTAAETADRFDVPVNTTLRFLRMAEDRFDTLIRQGDDTTKVRYRRALMLIGFADSYRTLGQSAESLKRAQEAYALLQDLTEHDSRNLDWQHDLLVAYQKVGNALDDQGQRQQAWAMYSASRGIAEHLVAAHPDKLEWQRDLSVAHNKLGDLLSAAGDLSQARESYEWSLQIRKDVVAREPTNDRWQRDLASAYDRLGSVLARQGHSALALENFRASMQIADRLSVADAENFDRQRNRSVVLEKIGDVLRAQGQAEQALASYQASLEIRTRLQQDDRRNARRQHDLVVTYWGMGDLLADQRRAAEAEANYRNAAEIMKALVESDPSNAGWQRNLALAYDKIGDVARALDEAPIPAPQATTLASAPAQLDTAPHQARLQQAQDSYRSAMQIKERLARADPSQMDSQYDLAVSHARVAGVLDALDDPAALAEYRAAKDIFERLLRAAPANAEWQHDLSTVDDRVGDMLRKQNDIAGAIASWRASLDRKASLVATDPDNRLWQIEVISLHWRLADEGDDVLHRWTQIVAILHGFERRGPITAEQAGWLADAERQLASMPATEAVERKAVSAEQVE